MKYSPRKRGHTLVELIVAVGLFAIIMLLASGAYLVVINLNRKVQNISTGINNVAFAIETMERDIRSGTGYTCPGGTTFCTLTNVSNCANSFSFKRSSGQTVAYCLAGTSPNQYIKRTIDGVDAGALTDVSAVSISTLIFYVYDTQKGNSSPPRVTMVITGTTLGKDPLGFTVETGGAMRGTDL